MLVKNGVESNLVEVVDNNEIDKYVTKYKPETVIIEALWVVPSKFEVLQKLHPKVQWVIRLHSELPFIANEGIAIQWLKQYVNYSNVKISANSKEFISSMEPILQNKFVYLPNYYPLSKPIDKKESCFDVLNVGLFGAIRPMKNCLTQAVAAMIFAERQCKKLNLHINTERVEQKGENTLKNLRALFEGTEHTLVEHKWYSHDDFVKLVATMDIGLQVSLTETYNIVTADFINQKVPVVTSKEISFVNFFSTVNSNKDANKIANKMAFTMKFKSLFTWLNKLLLQCDSNEAEKIWLEIFKS